MIVPHRNHITGTGSDHQLFCMAVLWWSCQSSLLLSSLHVLLPWSTAAHWPRACDKDKKSQNYHSERFKAHCGHHLCVQSGDCCNGSGDVCLRDKSQPERSLLFCWLTALYIHLPWPHLHSKGYYYHCSKICICKYVIWNRPFDPTLIKEHCLESSIWCVLFFIMFICLFMHILR